MSDQTKPTEQPQDADAAKMRRLKELKARITANSRFERSAEVAEHMGKLARAIRGSGQGFIIGMPKPPEGAA
jgi:hypothetical protein